MRISSAMLIATVFFFARAFQRTQTAPAVAAAPAPAASNTPAANPPFTPSAPSGILQHSLDEVQQTVGGVRLDKWKRGTVGEKPGTNIDAIQRDMHATLPALIKDADSAPGTLSKVLPLARNVDALYDVLVHIERVRAWRGRAMKWASCSRRWLIWRRRVSRLACKWCRRQPCRRNRLSTCGPPCRSRRFRCGLPQRHRRLPSVPLRRLRQEEAARRHEEAHRQQFETGHTGDHDSVNDNTGKAAVGGYRLASRKSGGAGPAGP